MYKELIIIVLVITLIVGLDIVTNNYTKNTTSIMSNELNMLREYILEQDKEKALPKMQDIKQIWEDRYKILTFYLEHDELEKVETELTSLAGFLNVEAYDECISELDKTIFILEHIQEKEEFTFASIF